jgi:hypothetical protein
MRYNDFCLAHDETIISRKRPSKEVVFYCFLPKLSSHFASAS